MMTTPSLIVAGKAISIISRLDCDQRIEPIGGATTRRLAGGAGFKMSHWQKHRVTLSGSGWIPAALNAVDYRQPFEIELPYPEAFAVGELLPAGWSSRAAPWLERTVTDSAGNAIRLVFPKMTVLSDGPTKGQGSNGPSWELVCEVL